MKDAEILLQGEDIPDIQVVKLDAAATAKDVLAAAARLRRSKAEGEFYAFAEDSDEPLASDSNLPRGEKNSPLRLHVHRCRRILVTVTFNGMTKQHAFGPGTTIAAVKRWAAIKAFGMDPRDAAEHVLQIAGTANRPEPDTHLGSLVRHPDCKIAFDLVPLKRIEG